MTVKRIFFVNPVTVGTAFTVPSDFGSLISIDCIGAGGWGANGIGGTGGGGGGGFGRSTTATGLAQGVTCFYFVGQNVDSWFRVGTNAAPTTAAEGALGVAGANGSGSTGGAGGAAANCVGDVRFSGGKGGNGSGGANASTNRGGGGGGGAFSGGIGGNGGDGMPNDPEGAGGGGGGAGSSGPGGNGSSATSGGAAGAGGGGAGGVGGTISTTPGPGQSGVIYSSVTNGGTTPPANPSDVGTSGGGGGADGRPGFIGAIWNGGPGNAYGGGGGGKANTRTPGSASTGVVVFSYNAVAPLNGSGPISLGGSTAGQSVNIRLGKSTTAQISFNDAAVRTLTVTSSGTTLVMPTNFYNK